jgi:predicted kinase
MNDYRLRHFNAVTGVTGSGKSTFCANVIKAYPQNVIVLKHIANINDPAFLFLPEKTTENFAKNKIEGKAIKCKISVYDKEQYKVILAWIEKNFANGLVLVDDATVFERDRLTLKMIDLVSLRRHLGIDIYLVYHGLSMFPIDQYIFLDYLILFNTSDSINYKKNKIEKIQQVTAAVLQARANYASNDITTKYRPVIINYRDC